MAKAYKAPSGTTPLRFYVTEHALERLRERVCELDIGYRGDYDLAHWLDEAVFESIKAGAVEAVIDDGDPARLVALHKENYSPTPFYALVKTNKANYKTSDAEEAIVTILDEAMVTSRRKRKWKTGSGGVVAAALARVSAADLKKATEKPKPTEPPAAETAANPDHIITWSDAGGQYQVVPGDEDVKRRIITLILSGVEPDTIRVWREVETKIDISINIGDKK